MKPSAKEFKRARPLLGTVVRIHFTAAGGAVDSEACFRQAFRELDRLSGIFNIFAPDSSLSRFNRDSRGDFMEIPLELFQVMQLAQGLESASRGAFRVCTQTPAPRSSGAFTLKAIGTKFYARNAARGNLDFNGIAKGYIVDRTVEKISARFPGLSGSINAGGDIKFFGGAAPCLTLRLGTGDAPLYRRITAAKPSIASSSLAGTERNPASQTRYDAPFAGHFGPGSTAVALANDCGIADALTKVAMFGDFATISRTVKKFPAEILLFAADGELYKAFGCI